MARLQPDAELLTRLLKPFYAVMRTREFTTPRFANTMLHVGCIFTGVGEWLLERDSMGQMIPEVKEGARPDTDATIEMVMANEAGTPVPPVKVR